MTITSKIVLEPVEPTSCIVQWGQLIAVNEENKLIVVFHFSHQTWSLLVRNYWFCIFAKRKKKKVFLCERYKRCEENQKEKNATISIASVFKPSPLLLSHPIPIQIISLKIYNQHSYSYLHT